MFNVWYFWKMLEEDVKDRWSKWRWHTNAWKLFWIWDFVKYCWLWKLFLTFEIWILINLILNFNVNFNRNVFFQLPEECNFDNCCTGFLQHLFWHYTFSQINFVSPQTLIIFSQHTIWHLSVCLIDWRTGETSIQSIIIITWKVF